MSEIRVVRLMNPDALELPVMRELFERAFDEIDFVPSADRVREWSREALLYDTIGFFVVRRDAELIGLSIMDADPGIWLDAAWSIYTWMKGAGQEALDALSDELVAFSVGHGKKTIQAMNRSHLSDDEYFKKLGHGTQSVRTLCTVMEFELAVPVEGE